MTERSPHAQATGEHILQLFDTSESRATAVSAFLQEGLDAGDHLLVAAKSRHWRSIRARLERRGCSVVAAIDDGRLTIVDAHAALGRTMRGQSPDPALFKLTIGSVVEGLAAGAAPLRIYGELVEVLAEEDNLDGACQLESLWNDLATRFRFVLLCGYSAAHFTDSAKVASLHSICGTHTRIQRHSSDMLGGWLHERSRAAGRTRDPGANPPD